MAYVTVPKDLTRVKSKIVFGLTKRQLICFGGALLVGVPLYFLLRGRVTGSAAALIMVFAMLPGFLLARFSQVSVQQCIQSMGMPPVDPVFLFPDGHMIYHYSRFFVKKTIP